MRERLRHARQVLARQAVDQVEVHRLEAVRARRRDHGRSLLEALPAVDRALHVLVEVLDADREAVEAERRQEGDRLRAGAARIHFDRVLAVGGERKTAADHGHQRAQLVVREERRSAAAPVQLADALVRAEEIAHELELASEVADVLRGTPAVLRDHLVAAAVVADRAAERQVHV